MPSPVSSFRARQFRIGFALPLLFALSLCLNPHPAAAQTKLKATQQVAGQVQAVVNNDLSPHLQMQMGELLAEKEARTPAQRKMDSNLHYALLMQRNQAITPHVPTLETGIEIAPDGTVLLDLKGSITDALKNSVRQMGGTIFTAFPQYRAMRLRLPLGQTENLAGNADVTFLRPASRAKTNTGSVTSEGDITMQAAAARTRGRVTGKGVIVGVLSDSIDFIGNSVASGDLNKNAGYIIGQTGDPGTGEGTAMMEIVQDMAPDADLLFATGFGGAANMAANIIALQKDGCSIIVDDVTYEDEDPFQDDIIAQAVNTVTNAGVLYFSSAANNGSVTAGASNTWEGDWVNSGKVLKYNNITYAVHSFGNPIYNTVSAVGSKGSDAVLYWSDALGNAGNDYDLFAADNNGNLVAASTNEQNRSQDPLEVIGNIQLGRRLYVTQGSGAQSRLLHLSIFGGGLSAFTSGNTFGHNAAANTITVAAVDVKQSAPFPSAFTSAARVETFSSDGPRHIFYNADGAAITSNDFTSTGGQVLQKPDIAAADGVMTTLSGFKPFFGTSAAAPHAAGVAALLKEYNPFATNAQIINALHVGCLDIMAAGIDRDSGYGLLRADLALAALPANPNVLPINGSVGGSLGVSGSKTLSLTLPAPYQGDLIVTLTTDATLAASMVIYDHDGKTSIGGGGYSTYGGSYTVTVPHVGPGTYAVTLANLGGTGGSYILTSQLVPPPLPDEENWTAGSTDDTAATAIPLGVLPAQHTGLLGYSRTAYNVTDDTDWYTITVPRDCDLTAEIDADSGVAVGMNIYDQDSTTGIGGGGYATYGGSYIASVPHLGPGIYYIQLIRYGGYGDYLFKASYKYPTVDDPEPSDDTRAGSAALTLGADSKGRLGWSRNPYNVTDDTDWYKVTVTGEGDLSVVVSADANVAVGLNVYDQDGTTALVSGGYATYGGTYTASVPQAAPGTYYVQLVRYGGYGYYTVRPTTAAPTVSDPEPNDTAAQAIALALNGSAAGRLGWHRVPYSVTDDNDWYKVTVPQDGDLSLKISADSGVAVGLNIYDQDGKTAIVSGGYATYGGSYSAAAPHVGPGTYYVQLVRYGGVGYYTLNSTFTPQYAPNDAEPNDTRDTAQVVPDLQNRYGHLGYGRSPYSTVDSQDWYKITLTAGTITTLGARSTLSASANLYDSSGTYLYTVSIGYGASVSLNTETLSAGTYYVLVAQAGGYGFYVFNQSALPSLRGTVDLGLAPNAPAQPITFTLLPTDGSASVTQTVNIGPSGTFVLPNLPRKLCNMKVVGGKWLQKAIGGVDLRYGDVSLGLALFGGDANGDNVVDIADFGALVNAYNGDASLPGSGYDVHADFNCDGVVDIADFGTLVNNYNLQGDP